MPARAAAGAGKLERGGAKPIIRRLPMAIERVHEQSTSDMAKNKFAIVLAGLTIFSAEPALSAGVDRNGQPCPDNSTSAPAGSDRKSGNSAENPASEQGVEHSGILPDASGQLDSAAPTVKKNGQEVTDKGCPKPPNQLHTSPSASQPTPTPIQPK
jgi:hypothetical protein